MPTRDSGWKDQKKYCRPRRNRCNNTGDSFCRAVTTFLHECQEAKHIFCRKMRWNIELYFFGGQRIRYHSKLFCPSGFSVRHKLEIKKINGRNYKVSWQAEPIEAIYYFSGSLLESLLKLRADLHGHSRQLKASTGLWELHERQGIRDQVYDHPSHLYHVPHIQGPRTLNESLREWRQNRHIDTHTENWA